MASGARPQREDVLRQLLSDKGIRVTEQRMLIMRELDKLRVPASHAELTERLSGSTLDRATIYRNLVSLTEAGLLVKTQLGDGVWRFELPRTSSTTHGEHPHFVCTDCGSVACLPEGTISIRGGSSLRDRVSEIQLRGHCEACSR
jgi:Fur family ferric uptake transcriptional regulator